MVRIDIDTEDMKEIGRFVTSIGGAIHLSVRQKGTLAMSSVVGKAARRSGHFLDQTGLLRKSIGWRPKSTTIVVPIVLKTGRVVNRRRRVKGNAVVFTWGKGSGGQRPGIGARYGYLVERGHNSPATGPVQGRFYLESAFKQNFNAMAVAFLRKAREEVATLKSELGGERNIRQITRKLLVARTSRF